MNVCKDEEFKFWSSPYFLLIFPSALPAAPAVSHGVGAFAVPAAAAAVAAAYWSKEFGVSVAFVEPKVLLLCLEVENGFCKILAENGTIGWIRDGEWVRKATDA